MTQISIPRIIAAVAEHFGTTAAELTGPERTQTICARRAVAYRLCNELTDVPYLQIGKQFGGRDHTSVLRAIVKPLDLQHKIAFDRLSADLTRGTGHARDVMMRWQFKSRRTAPMPVFIRNARHNRANSNRFGFRVAALETDGAGTQVSNVRQTSIIRELKPKGESGMTTMEFMELKGELAVLDSRLYLLERNVSGGARSEPPANADGSELAKEVRALKSQLEHLQAQLSQLCEPGREDRFPPDRRG